MTVPILKLTTAGRAAMVNVENTGTAAIRVAQIGVTSQAFVPTAALSSLPGEIKRLSTFAGAAVADDTIHITLRDDSTDQYALLGFGLYAESGLLLATYGQAEPIMEKSAQAMLLLSVDGRIDDLLATSLTFGDTNWMNPPATTTVPGVVELLTNTEAITGADTTRAMTAATTKAVLDARLGQSAPTAVTKTLLAAATTQIIRQQLGLKNAALRDEGSGNSLDADLLDGQHGSYYLAWANLEGKPSTFPPDAHGHPWSAISEPPATATRWPTWSEVANKPPTYPPAAHVHAAGDIQSGTFDDARIPALAIAKVTGLQNALNAKINTTGGDVSGQLRVILNVPPPDASAYNQSHLELRTTDLSHPRVGFHRGGSDAVALTYMGGVRMSLWTNGGAQYDLWTTENLTPVKLNSDNIGAVKLIGGGAAYYVRDRTSGRDWATYATGDMWHVFNGASNVVSVDANGKINANGGFKYGSARALKTRMRAMPYGLAEVEQIEVGVGYYKRAFNRDGRRRLFVFAEQLRDVVPEVVDDHGATMRGKQYGAVDYAGMVPLLIQAIKDLARSIRDLSADIRNLRDDVKILKRHARATDRRR